MLRSFIALAVSTVLLTGDIMLDRGVRRRIEADGIVSPVMAVEGRYLHTTTFDDVIDVEVFIKEMSPLKLRIGYRMRVGETEVFEGMSLHCFLGKDGRPVRILERYPQFGPYVPAEEE